VAFDQTSLLLVFCNTLIHMSNLKRCSKCLLPETHETITFDTNGVCSVCQNSFMKSGIDWEKRKEQLDRLVSETSNASTYDCIVPFSGGKDSVWTLYYVVTKLKLKPLVVSFDHGFYRPNLVQNRDKVLKKLGVDSIVFTPNWNLVRRLMLQSFLEKGDFCWHCHTGIFSYPMWVAIEKNIPLIIWGEPSSEYTSYYDYSEIEHVDEDRFNRIINLGMTAEDMLERLDSEFTMRDLHPFTYPPLKALNKLGVKSIPLGSFIPWDVKTQTLEIIQELDWKGDFVEGVPPGYEYEKIECFMQGVRDYIKFIKRGYSRTTHLTSIDVRNGRLERSDAIKLINEYEGKRPFALDLFLEYTGLTEEEFMKVAISHKVTDSPNAVQVSIGKRPPDFEDWNRWPGIKPEQGRLIMGKWEKDQ
jgi:N-acetyl sugar amidotransferase